MLGKIVILPAMLLVLGVTDASAETCRVDIPWAALRSDPSVPDFPKYRSPDKNKLCELHEGVEIHDVRRSNDSRWVSGTVQRTEDGNGECEGYGAGEVKGYIAEWIYNGVQVLHCE
jgi:hypothetical protein